MNAVNGNLTKVLIVSVKWADLNPERPLCPSTYTLIETLQNSGAGVPHVFFCDEHVHKTKKPCDEDFVKFCFKICPDLLLLFPTQHDVSINLGNGDNRNHKFYGFPRNETIKFIRDRLGIPVITAVGDAWGEEAFIRFEKMKECSDKILLFDPASDFLLKTKTPEKYAVLWFPVNQTVFHRAQTTQDILVSFIGRTYCEPENHVTSIDSPLHQYAYRNKLLQKLVSMGCPIFQAGGVQSSFPLPLEVLVNYLQRSKITLNFTYHTPMKRLFRGRTWEAINCGAMLLEEDNKSIQYFLEPMKHYIPFSNIQEAFDRAHFFLDHEKFRMDIAEGAHQIVQQEYNEKNFWRRCLNLVFN